jgi:hypothetical protein
MATFNGTCLAMWIERANQEATLADGGTAVFVQYCQCVQVANFEDAKKIVLPNGPFRKTVLYCCKECYEKFFGESG